MSMLSLEATATFLVLMYVASGANKVLTLGASEAGRFAEKTGFSPSASTRLVFLAGLWELVASALVLRGVWQLSGERARKSVRAGTGGLVVFTVLATLIFYARPFRFKPVLANLTAIAGLVLLPRVCELKR